MQKNNWYTRKLNNLTFCYHDGISPLIVFEERNGRTYFKFAKYRVEVIQLTADGWIVLKKNNFMGIIDFDGNEILPFEYHSIFSSCSGINVKRGAGFDWELA